MPILPLPPLRGLQLMDQPNKLGKVHKLGQLNLHMDLSKQEKLRVVLLQRVMNPPRPCLSLPLMLVVVFYQWVNLKLPGLVLDRYT